MDPLFINNREAFSSDYIKLYDQDSKLIEFHPVMRHRMTNHRRNNIRIKSGTLKIDNAKTKFYSIEQIRKNKFKIVLDGQELSPYDLYYFFDNLYTYKKYDLCQRQTRVPPVIYKWLMAKQDRSHDSFWP